MLLQLIITKRIRLLQIPFAVLDGYYRNTQFSLREYICGEDIVEDSSPYLLAGPIFKDVVEKSYKNCNKTTEFLLANRNRHINKKVASFAFVAMTIHD